MPKPKEYYINGIQQIGIGNRDVYATYDWYKQHLGFSVQVFDEAAEAALMLPYTGGEKRKRHAILALNLAGGGGVEIWQYVERKAEKCAFEPKIGDLGIFIAQYKVKSIQKSHIYFSDFTEVSPIFKNPANQKHFYAKDIDGNWIDLIEADNWFNKNRKHHSGGVYGAVIGVSNLKESLEFYQDILGYDVVMSRVDGRFEDYSYLTNENVPFDRAILTHSDQKSGAFSNLLGNTQLELVQRRDYQPRKIFQDRLWGDMGYIHLCFDVNNMDALRKKCVESKHPFTVDSGDFDMGDAAGHFAYIEDPDGTLIEFVETFKVPIIKKLNWFLDLKKRKKHKPLPNWMIKAMGI